MMSLGMSRVPLHACVEICMAEICLTAHVCTRVYVCARARLFFPLRMGKKNRARVGKKKPLDLVKRHFPDLGAHGGLRKLNDCRCSAVVKSECSSKE